MTRHVPARYLIGIDLGTTNSAVAYVDSQAADTRGKPHFTPSRRQLTLSPRARRNSVSAASMNRKKFEKCMIPAMSVSPNSTRRVVWNIAECGMRSAECRKSVTRNY